jgi:hypothetical protein
MQERCEWCENAIMPLEPYLFIEVYGKNKHTICLECYLHIKDEIAFQTIYQNGKKMQWKMLSLLWGGSPTIKLEARD